MSSANFISTMYCDLIASVSPIRASRDSFASLMSRMMRTTQQRAQLLVAERGHLER